MGLREHCHFPLSLQSTFLLLIKLLPVSCKAFQPFYWKLSLGRKNDFWLWLLIWIPSLNQNGTSCNKKSLFSQRKSTYKMSVRFPICSTARQQVFSSFRGESCMALMWQPGLWLHIARPESELAHEVWTHFRGTW